MIVSLKRWRRKVFPEKYELLIFLISYVVLFLLTINYKRFGDDVVNFNAASTIGIWSHFINRMETWQPRIIADIILVFFTMHLNLWKVIAPLPVVAALFDFYHITNKKPDIRLLILALSSIMLVSTAAFYICYLWVAGWATYAVAFSLMWFALKPYVKLTRGISSGGLDSAADKIIYFIIAVSACWEEQFVAMLIGFLVCSIAFARYKKISITKTMWMYSATTILFSGIFIYLNLKSPRIRNLGELGNFFPDFDMHSLIDKFFQMLNLTHNSIIYDSQFIMFPMLCMIAYVIYKKHKSFVRFYGFLPLGLQILLTFPFKLFFENQIHVSVAITDIFTRMSSGYNVSDIEVHIASLFVPFCTTVEVCLVGASVFLIFDEVSEKFTSFVFWLGGLGCSYILMFSPTMYESGNRLFYLISMQLVFLFVGVCGQSFRIIKSEAVKNVYVIAQTGVSVFIWCSVFILSNVLHGYLT